MNKNDLFHPQLLPGRLRNHVETLRRLSWISLGDLEVEIGETPGPADPAEASGNRYRRILPGEVFSLPEWNHRWFRFSAESLPDIPSRQPLGAGGDLSVTGRHIEWRVNGETLFFSGDEPWCGLDTAHLRAPLPPAGGARDGRYYLKCGTYQTGMWMRPGEDCLPPVPPAGLTFHSARLVFPDPLCLEAEPAMEILRQWIINEIGRWRGESSPGGYQPPLEKAPPVLRRMILAVDGCIDLFDRGDFTGYREVLEEIFRRFSLGDREHTVAVAGNSHIDLVWLWPESVTREKTLHTCATTLRLMESNPDFCFTFTQPEMLERVMAGHPRFREEILKRIREGRWELLGGMDVEGDTLVPSGESILRNILIGQERFTRLTGSPSEILWLPDAFGFPVCLPQLAAQGGMKYFFTTKLTWSALNRFPLSSFRWESPDGSFLLSHLARLGYEARGSVTEVEACAFGNTQGGIHPESLLAVGFGDGGGGVTPEQCRRVSRLASLPGLPECRWSRADEFFARMEKTAEELPVHRGELYLEYHRGTLTTMAGMKRLYRQAELVLRDWEAAAAVKGVPADTRPFWERMCFFQFHDAIPGSSIDLVYRQILPELEDLILAGRKALGEVLSSSSGEAVKKDRHPDGVEMILWNPLPVPFRFSLELPEEFVSRALPPEGGEPVINLEDGKMLTVQRIAGGSWLVRPEIPALGTVILRAAPGDKAAAEEASRSAGLEVSPDRLAWGDVRARFDRRGRLTDLQGRGKSAGLAGPARFRLFRDRPADFEAWEVDDSSQWMELPEPEFPELRVVESGPLRGILAGEAPLGRASRIEIRYILEAGSPVLRVGVRIDWQEEGVLLKYELDTGCTDGEGLYGAPFNSVRRLQSGSLTGGDPLWEVPASRWAALTDGLGRGPALISRDKYGFSCREGRLGVTLLRSPLSSDDNYARGNGIYLDKGFQETELALTVHEAAGGPGGFSTAQLAEILFSPAAPASRSCGTAPVEILDAGSLCCSWVKPPERGTGIVYRFHETAGAAGTLVLRIGDRSLKTAVKVTILEASLGSSGSAVAKGGGEVPEEYLPDGRGDVRISYRAHEILTVLLRP